MAEKYLLGSGDLYIATASGLTLPEDATIEVVGNLIGSISGGAVLEYKPTVYDIENDAGSIVKRVVTKEEVTFKSGVLNFNLENLARLVAGGSVSTDGQTLVKTLKVGGVKSLGNYVIHFVHSFDDGSKLKLDIIGNATDGFSFNFAKDKETIIDSVFKAISQTDGTLVQIREVPAAGTPLLTFTCVDGTGANATKIASVSPTLTGGNSYLYKINAAVPALGADITGLGWTAYTLAADIPCVNGQSIVLVEASTGDVVVKAGSATTVVV